MTPKQTADRKRRLDSAFQQIAAYQVAAALHEAKPDFAEFEKKLGGAAVGHFTTAEEQWMEAVKAMACAFLDRNPDFDFDAFYGACKEAGYA
jgi:hypothetical protein